MGSDALLTDSERSRAETALEALDAEIVAARENRRIWWRRAVVMSLVVALGAPIGALGIWRIRMFLNPPVSTDLLPTNDPTLRNAYAEYMRWEGPDRRGWNFFLCAMQL